MPVDDIAADESSSSFLPKILEIIDTELGSGTSSTFVDFSEIRDSLNSIANTNSLPFHIIQNKEEGFIVRAKINSLKQCVGLGSNNTLSIDRPFLFYNMEDVAITPFTVTASGGTAPYTYANTGFWPAGMSINTSSGVVSGTPTTAGEYTGGIKVTDNVGANLTFTPIYFRIIATDSLSLNYSNTYSSQYIGNV